MNGIHAPIRTVVTTRAQQKVARKAWRNQAKPFFRRAIAAFIDDLESFHGIVASFDDATWDLLDATVEGKMWWGTVTLSAGEKQSEPLSIPCVPLANLRWYAGEAAGSKWHLRAEGNTWLWQSALSQISHALTAHCDECGKTEVATAEYELGSEAGLSTWMRTLCAVCVTEYQPATEEDSDK